MISSGTKTSISTSDQSLSVRGPKPRLIAKVPTAVELRLPRTILDFLRAPFAGYMDREVLNKERWQVALSGNAGRVVIRHWLDQPSTRTIENLRPWWSDLQIVPLSSETKKKKSPKGEATKARRPRSRSRISPASRYANRRAEDREDGR